MDRGTQSVIYGIAHGSSCTGSLRSNAGKLLDRPSGVTGRNFLCDRLDRRYEAFSALRGKIRSLQPDVPRTRLDHRAAHLDVPDLSAAVAGRKIERHSPARAQKNVRRCACGPRACGHELRKLRRNRRRTLVTLVTFLQKLLL